MTQVIKQNGNSLFPALSDFFETDKWISPDKVFRGFPNSSLPAANISETDKEYKIELSAPGFKKDEIKIDLENETLTIYAESKMEKEEKGKKYTRKEFSYETFTRSFLLPRAANGDKIHAKYEDGLLKLTIHKKEEAINRASKKEIKIT
jgi:HSP20 family protein